MIETKSRDKMMDEAAQEAVRDIIETKSRGNMMDVQHICSLLWGCKCHQHHANDNGSNGRIQMGKVMPGHEVLGDGKTVTN